MFMDFEQLTPEEQEELFKTIKTVQGLIDFVTFQYRRLGIAKFREYNNPTIGQLIVYVDELLQEVKKHTHENLTQTVLTAHFLLVSVRDGLPEDLCDMHIETLNNYNIY